MHKDTFNLKINNITLHYDNLPNELKNYKIGFVSDIHLGPSNDLKFFEMIINKLNEQDLDLLLLGGDYIWLRKNVLFSYKRNKLFNTNDDKKNAKNIYKVLIDNFSKVKTKDGIIAVYGNHDNWLYPNILNKLAKKSNVQLAKNKKIYISKSNSIISVWALQDFWRDLPNIKANDKLLHNDRNEFRILLAHNPDTITYLLKYNKIQYNLSLSGHTHGGQIKIPFILNMSNTYYKKNIDGLNILQNNQYHYTSQGLGFTSVPFRLNVYPEIVIFTLNTK